MQLYSARRPSGAKTIACNCFRIWAGLSLSISVWLVTSYPKMSSDEKLLLLSRDFTKRCHWLQHFGLMNIFEHVWKPAIIACNNWSELHAINCTCNHGLRRSGMTRVLSWDHTVLPATHTCIHKCNESCLSLHPSRRTSPYTFWPALISRPAEGKRLSWPGLAYTAPHKKEDTDSCPKLRHMPSDFWAAVCKTVGPMLSDRCLSVLSVCLWCWCVVARRLDGSRWNLGYW